MKNRHNFEFSPKTMLVFLTIICILLLSVSAVLKDAVKPLSAVAETVVIPMQDGINSFGVWVGDHAGSFKSMKELKKEGKTMVFVTHGLESAKELCDRAVWINKGVIRMDGNTDEVIKKYIEETA